MAGWLFLAGVGDVLVPPSTTPEMLDYSCFAITVDTIGEATTLTVGYHLTTQHWRYPKNFSFG